MAQKVHLPNFSTISECEILAIAEVRERLGRMVQKRFGIPRFYPNHIEMAKDRKIDAFAVSANAYVQGEIAKDLLQTGRPVFMEKPMAVSVAQAEAILKAAQTPGARLMIAYMKRYDSGNELVSEKLDAFRSSGELGAVTYARSHGFCGDWISGLDTPMDTIEQPKPELSIKGPEWMPEEYLSSYIAYLQQYTHNVNLLRYFLHAGENVRLRAVDLGDDGYSGVVSFDMKGVHAILETGSLAHHRWDEHTQIYFEKGWVKTWAPPLLLKNVPAEVEIYHGGEEHIYSRPLPGDRWSWSYWREARHFISCLQSGTAFRSSGEDTLTDVRLFEEIYKAYLEGKGVL